MLSSMLISRDHEHAHSYEHTHLSRDLERDSSHQALATDWELDMYIYENGFPQNT